MADTSGDQQVVIEGTDFPPGGQGELGYAFYGPVVGGGIASPPIEAICTVATAYEKLHCLTGQGSGKNHSWLLEVDGQRSEIYHAGTSYAPPVIQSLLDESGNLILSAHTSGR
jgi:hypothetical protein